MNSSIEDQLQTAFSRHAALVSEDAVTRLQQLNYGPKRSNTGGVLVGVGLVAALVVGAGAVAADRSATPGSSTGGRAATPVSVPMTGESIQLADAQIATPAGFTGTDMTRCALLNPGINHTSPPPDLAAPYGGVITPAGVSIGLVGGGGVLADESLSGTASGCIQVAMVNGGTQMAPAGSQAVTLGAYQGVEIANPANGQIAVAVTLPVGLYPGVFDEPTTASGVAAAPDSMMEIVVTGVGVPAADVEAVATAATTPQPVG
jgi:hypothetical protein